MKLHHIALSTLVASTLVACGGDDDNDSEVRELQDQVAALQDQLQDDTQVTELQNQIAALQAELQNTSTLSAEEITALEEEIASLQDTISEMTGPSVALGSLATTGANVLAKDNTDNLWKYALFPDMQGRDDDDYSIELTHTNPDGTVVNNEALTRSGSFYVGVDVNQDGIWDGSSHQIDVTDPLNPTFVLDENGFAIPVNSADRKDSVGDWKTLPYPHAEAVIDKIIEEDVDVVFFLGDITEHRAEHEYVQFRDYIMKPLQDAGIGIVPIRGNHEIVNGRNWLAWFSADYELAKTSVNNVDNGVDVYEEGAAYDQGYALYHHYVGSVLDDRIESGEITPYSEEFPDLVFHYTHGNTLFIALDPYFGDLVSTNYRATWIETYDWIQQVIEENAETVDHIVVINHEGFSTRRRPQMYEEEAYNAYLNLLDEEYFQEATTAESDDERPEALDLLAYDVGQLGYITQQAESQPNLVEDLFGLFAHYNVHYLVGHDHQYKRSAIHSIPGDKRSPFFTEIISGNASWKAYENNFGTNALYESAIAQQNFVDIPDSGAGKDHSSTISFVIAEVNNRQVTYTNHYARLNGDIGFDDGFASKNQLRYDYDNNQWNFFEEVNGTTVNNPITITWKIGDVASYTSDAVKRIVGPTENYFTTTTTPDGQGYIGTEFTIIDGNNMTYNSSSAALRLDEEGGATLQNMSELLALSWFTDNDDTTLSDIIFINGNQNQDGTFFDYDGFQQRTTVTDSSLGIINRYGSRNDPATTIDGDREVSISPSTVFHNRNGELVNNPTMVTRDGELVKGTDYAAEHALDYGPMDDLYTGDNIIGENGRDFADAMAVAITVPEGTNLDEITLGRWDEVTESWVPAFNELCFANTGYSDHYNVQYRLDEQEPEGGFGIDGCEQQYWGYIESSNAIWGFIHTDGYFAVIANPDNTQ